MGPQSVGSRLNQEALVFGGHTLTASDIAVAASLTSMGSVKPSEDMLPATLMRDACDRIHEMLEEAIDKVKVRVVIKIS